MTAVVIDLALYRRSLARKRDRSSADRLLELTRNLDDETLRLFVEDMHDLLQFGGDVGHPEYLANIVGRTVTVAIGETVCGVSDEELSRVVSVLAEVVVGNEREVSR
jgi:hypothetical protein